MSEHRTFTTRVASVYPHYVTKAEKKGRTKAEVDTIINTALITGVVCGVRVESVEDPLMQQIRWLDKLVDELARGKAMHKILRSTPQ